jgi:hypothetical protein
MCRIESARERIQGISDGLGLNKKVKIDLHPNSATAHTSHGSDIINVNIPVSISSDEHIKSILLHEYAHIVSKCSRIRCFNHYPAKGNRPQRSAHCDCWLREYKRRLKKYGVKPTLTSNDKYDAGYYLDEFEYNYSKVDGLVGDANVGYSWINEAGGNKYRGGNAIACAIAGEDVRAFGAWYKAGYLIEDINSAYKLSSGFSNCVMETEDDIKWLTPYMFNTLAYDETAGYTNVSRSINFNVFCEHQVTNVGDTKADLKVKLMTLKAQIKALKKKRKKMMKKNSCYNSTRKESK